MRRLSAGLLLVAALFAAACTAAPTQAPSLVPSPRDATPAAATPAASTPPASVEPSSPDVRPLPPELAHVEPGPGDPSAQLTPRSEPAQHGVRHRFSLEHCGLGSPIDFDGSLWDVVGAQHIGGGPLTEEHIGELINQTAGTIVVEGDRGQFLTPGDAVVELRRHEGAKDYPLCS